MTRELDVHCVEIWGEVFVPWLEFKRVLKVLKVPNEIKEVKKK